MKKQKFKSVDFTVSNLPSTRKALFFDILKHKYRTIFLLGISIFLFLIPCFLSNLAFDSFLNKASMDSNIVNNNQLTSMGLDVYRFGIVLFAFINIFTYLIAFIGIGGVMRIIRRLSWNEGILYWNDFWIGVKQNVKQFIVISLIFSLGNALIYLSKAVMNRIVYGIVYGLVFGIINPFIIISICYASTYSIKTGKVLLNSFTLFVKNFFLGLLFSLFTLSYYFLNFIPIPIVVYCSKIIVIIFLMPIVLLGIYLSLSNVFDKTINSFAHPELVKKGLYIKEESSNDKNI